MDFVQIIFAISCCFAAAKLGECNRNDYLFGLVQEWPPGLCKIYETTGTKCDIPRSAKPWFIHGLWMESGPKGTEKTENCTFSESYKEAYMKSIMKEMDMYWPSVFKRTKKNEFWNHEWETHGRCCTKCRKLLNQTRYFTATLNLRQQYDLYSMLTDKGIVPSNNQSYKASELARTITQWFGKKVTIRCGNIKGTSYFFRVMLCFDGSLNPTDCDKSASLTNWTDKPSQKCSKSVNYPSMPRISFV